MDVILLVMGIILLITGVGMIGVGIFKLITDKG